MTTTTVPPASVKAHLRTLPAPARWCFMPASAGDVEAQRTLTHWMLPQLKAGQVRQRPRSRFPFRIVDVDVHTNIVSVEELDETGAVVGEATHDVWWCTCAPLLTF